MLINICFNHARNHARNHAIKLAKIAAHDKIILNSSNKQKSMLSLINKNRNPKNSLNIKYFISPNNFNNYFCFVADTIIKQIDVSKKTFLDVFKKKITLKQTFSFTQGSEIIVRDAILSLKSSKCSSQKGCDG